MCSAFLPPLGSRWLELADGFVEVADHSAVLNRPELVIFEVGNDLAIQPSPLCLILEKTFFGIETKNVLISQTF